MYLKSFCALLILVSISILADFNGKRGVMVSANPQPGHSQLRYYKEERKNRHKERQARNRGSDPWAQPWGNNAKSLHHTSSLTMVLIVSILKYMYY